MPNQHVFIAIQYGIAAAIFYIYGVEVCPFLDELDTHIFTRSIAVLFLFLFLLRYILVKYWLGDTVSNPTKKQFIIDLSVFFSGGFILALGNTLAFSFPLEASFRVLFGFSFLGYFVSLQLKLRTEHRLLKSGENIRFNKSDPVVPIGKSMSRIVFSLLAGAIVSLLMVVWKDFEWLHTINNEVSIEQAALWILYEFIFVGIVFFAYGSMINHYLSNNLSLSFQHQTSALAAIKSGRRDVFLPSINNNEFRELASDTNHMLKRLITSENDLNKTRDTCILAISSLAEARDNETGAHIIRTQEYIKALCLELKNHPKFADELTDEVIEHIYKSAPLHDIGKVGIPDAILLKPGKLTDEEFEIMKTHPIIGRQAIKKAEQQHGDMPFLQYAKAISEFHHEKFDGSGYPHGLKGDAIPLSARLMALADVYDALISKRVYKPAFSHEKSKTIILEGKGTHFDPIVVDAFIAVETEFIRIAQNHQDEE